MSRLTDNHPFRNFGRRLPRLAVLAAVGLIAGASQLQAAMPKALCHVPAFIDSGDSVKPNVMLLIDNSGSMAWPTYSVDPFDPARHYYGYWESDRCYGIQSNRWIPDTSRVADPGNECNYSSTYSWSGNFLNWAYMTRMEVMKRALIGGVQVNNGGRIIFENAAYAYDIWNGDYWWYCAPGGDGAFWSRYTPIPTNRRGIRLARIGDEFYARGYRNCFGGSSNTVLNWQRIQNGIVTVTPPIGVLNEVEQNARWAFATFDNGNGGRVEHYYGFNQNNSSGPSIFNRIENLTAGGNTPLGESLYEMVRFHQQVRPYYRSNHYLYGPGGNRDPWYEWEGAKATVPCRETFMVVVSDGSPTSDSNFPSDLDIVNTGTQPRDFDGDGNEPTINTPVPNWPPAVPWVFLQPNSWTSDYLDDIALWAHTTDLRQDIGGTQSITSYYLFAFGDIQGSERSAPFIMWNAAINGAFVDKNGNDRPDDPSEWDEDGDNIPDAFFLAQEGDELEAQLRALLSAVLNRAASGTKAAIVPQQGQGQRGGTVGAQAYFKPEIDDSSGNSTTWAGFLRGFWIDRFFNFRDGEDNSKELHLKKDHIAVYEFVTDQTRLDALLGSGTVPVESGQTVVKLYWDMTDPADPNEAPDGAIGALDKSVLIDDFVSLFQAGKLLHRRDPATRRIITNLGIDTRPAKFGGAVQTVEFDTSNAAALQPFLSSVDPPYAPDLAETIDLIEYVRGWDKAGWRSRTITIDGFTGTWKLGDIMNSTPQVQGPPSEGTFDKIASSYNDYIRQYRDRPHVLYVGANDGMLHAFYVGEITTVFDPSDPHLVAKLETDGIHEPGDELWGFIPHVLLPQLHWLKEDDYCHTYYVDGTPFITPIHTFQPDAKHPNGWGEILVGTLRLGCTPVEMSGGTIYYSSVFVLDITDPFDPEVLFEWFDPSGQMGFTTSGARVFGLNTVKGSVSASDFCTWLTWGSGPTDYAFTSAQSPAKIYWKSLNEATGGGASNCKDAVLSLPRYEGSYVEEVVGTPLGLDVIDGPFSGLQGDVVYYPTMTLQDPFGPTYDMRGRIIRLDPVPKSGASSAGDFASADPADWQLTELTRLPAPFVTRPDYFRQLRGLGEAPPQGTTWRIAIFAGTGRFYNLEDAGFDNQQYLLKIEDECWYAERADNPCNAPSDYLYDFGGPTDKNDRFMYVDQCDFDFSAPDATQGLSTNCEVDGDAVSTLGDFNLLEAAAKVAVPNENNWLIPLDYQERLIFDPVVSDRIGVFSTYLPIRAQLCSAAAGQSGLRFIDISGLTLLKQSAGGGQTQVDCVGEDCERIVITDDKGQVDTMVNPFISKPLKGLESLMQPFSLWR